MTAQLVDPDWPARDWVQNARRQGSMLRAAKSTQARKKKVEERLVRLEWYLREHGRPPTWDELMQIRAHRKLPKALTAERCRLSVEHRQLSEVPGAVELDLECG